MKYFEEFLRDSEKFLNKNLETFVRLAAFGKHPGWDDHIDDYGICTDSLAQAKRALYLDSVSGNIDRAVWENLDASMRDDSFDSAFIWRRNNSAIVGKMWSSKDGKGRDKYPMIICCHCKNTDRNFINRKVFPFLDSLEIACKNTESASAVLALLHDAQAALDADISAAASQRDDAPSCPQEFSACSDTEIERILYSVRNDIPVVLSDSEKGAHFRLPKKTDDIWSWGDFFANTFGSALPTLSVFKQGNAYIDLVAGLPDSRSLLCLKANTDAISTLSEINFSFNADVKKIIEEFVATAKSAFAYNKKLLLRDIEIQAAPNEFKLSDKKPFGRFKIIFSIVAVIFISAFIWFFCFKKAAYSDGTPSMLEKSAVQESVSESENLMLTRMRREIADWLNPILKKFEDKQLLDRLCNDKDIDANFVRKIIEAQKKYSNFELSKILNLDEAGDIEYTLDNLKILTPSMKKSSENLLKFFGEIKSFQGSWLENSGIATKIEKIKNASYVALAEFAIQELAVSCSGAAWMDWASDVLDISASLDLLIEEISQDEMLLSQVKQIKNEKLAELLTEAQREKMAAANFADLRKVALSYKKQIEEITGFLNQRTSYDSVPLNAASEFLEVRNISEWMSKASAYRIISPEKSPIEKALVFQKNRERALAQINAITEISSVENKEKLRKQFEEIDTLFSELSAIPNIEKNRELIVESAAKIFNTYNIWQADIDNAIISLKSLRALQTDFSINKFFEILNDSTLSLPYKMKALEMVSEKSEYAERANFVCESIPSVNAAFSALIQGDSELSLERKASEKEKVTVLLRKIWKNATLANEFMVRKEYWRLLDVASLIGFDAEMENNPKMRFERILKKHYSLLADSENLEVFAKNLALEISSDNLIGDNLQVREFISLLEKLDFSQSINSDDEILSKVGPGLRGWRYEKGNREQEIFYVNDLIGVKICFVLCDDPNGGAVYIQKHEVSLELFSKTLFASEAAKSGFDSLLEWNFENRILSEGALGWQVSKDAKAMDKRAFWLDRADVSNETPSLLSPMHWISYAEASRFAGLLNCELPEKKIILSTIKKSTQNWKFNLRDSEWLNNFESVKAQNNISSIWPDFGIFTDGQNFPMYEKAVISRNFSDSYAWFCTVVKNEDPLSGLCNIIGNVAEFVRDSESGSAHIIGASALSPKELPEDVPYLCKDLSMRYSDVGFRLSFKSPGTDFRKVLGRLLSETAPILSKKLIN